MRAFVASIVAIALVAATSAAFFGSAETAADAFATQSTRVGDPGSNLIGKPKH